MIKKKYRLFAFLVVLLLISLIIMVPGTASPQKGKIKVLITGFKSNKGRARYGLYDSKETFLKNNKTFRNGALIIKNKKCEFSIENVPYGIYALAIGHDENENGKIDKFFPTEPNGISNFKQKLRWWPRFDKAKFALNSKLKFMEIRIF